MLTWLLGRLGTGYRASSGATAADILTLLVPVPAGFAPNCAHGPSEPAGCVPCPFQTTAPAGPWRPAAGTLSMFVVPSLSLTPSKVRKKNVLSFLMGPPVLAPKLLLRKGGRRWNPFAASGLSKKFAASRILLR